MARVLHDTVLQTLALVERRVATTDPELAGAAREADSELRAFLFGGDGRPATDLRSRLHLAVEQARRRAPSTGSRITLNVIDDGCRVREREQDLLARAVGEAVANALEHAAAEHIVVFAETDDAGQLFVTVRDDGAGFDPSTVTAGYGVAESITARMDSIGGRAEVRSSPGIGTEIRLWSSAR